MRKVLWLASWYPGRTDPYTGDYIERHARAASLENEISVLHIVRDPGHVFPEKKWVEHRQYKEGAEATIIYYHTPEYRISWFEKLHSIYLYVKYHIDYFKNYLRVNGKPDGIHVHIGLKAGLAALLLKFRYRIPYIVSEHWSGLCPEAKPGFNDLSLVSRWLWKKVMKNAAGYSAVSEYLAEAMQNRFYLKKVKVIPNVVDTNMFYPSGKVVNNPRFIHISTIKNYQKNVREILEAAAIMVNRLPDFSLIIFGQPDESLENYVRFMNLGQAVEFKGMCAQEILREYLQESIALILYSRFETFGCVIIEANACGKPVIVSDIPVFHENVKAGLTGALVPLNNPWLLADAMVAVAKDKYLFDPEQIHQWAVDHYSFERVGRQFAELYETHFA
jgi:glycosyltransferase involved in cell wall biosynthesis